MLFEETQKVRLYSWKRAYFDCMGCLNFMKKSLPRFEARFKLKGLSLPIVISVILIILSFLIADHNNWRISLAIIVAVALTIAIFVIYFLYFYYLDYHMMFCDNRIEIYDGIWPGMIELINSRVEQGDYTLPDEPDAIKKWMLPESESLVKSVSDLKLTIDDDSVICEKPDDFFSESIKQWEERFDNLSKQLSKLA